MLRVMPSAAQAELPAQGELELAREEEGATVS
jgi:hypothetical protein